MADNIDITPGAGKTVATDDAGAAGHVQVIKLAISTDGSATYIPADATYGLDVDVTRLPALAAGTNNIGDVDVLSLPAPLGTAGATSLAKAEDDASASADVGIAAMAVRKATPANTSDTDGDYEMLQISAGRLWTSATVDTALPAGTNAIGKLAANSGVDIGDVDVTSLTGGTVAHDDSDSGNPIKVGAKAQAAAASVTVVAAGDRTDAVSDLDGALITRMCRLADLISDVLAITDGSSTAFSGSFAAAANLYNYITSVTIANTSATAVTVSLRDGAAGSTLYTFPVPANTSGITVAFNPPLRQPTANTALAADPSAAASTVTTSVNGFKSKA